MFKYILCIILFSNLLIAQPVFVNGVHFENQDEKTYIIKLTTSLSTRICHIKKSTETIKNGIAPINIRKSNIKITNHSEDMLQSISIEIPPKTSIPCVCATGCSFEIVTIGKYSVKNNHNIVIKDGKVKILKSILESEEKEEIKK
ncbi:hypothetical protein JXR93_08455 [bacterium]|nr:hypothetical protein [bacterium]